jgi:enoyl-CoA hydratase/carnithine racemase
MHEGQLSGALPYQVDEAGVARLEFTSGGPLNIIGSATAVSAAAALRKMGTDPRVRVVVISGSGRKTFIGGADIRELMSLNPASARRFIGDLHKLCEAARDLPVPSICGVSGWCIGVGVEFAASCDIRIATAGARFVMPEVKLGIPSVIQAAFLSRLIGEGRARWLMLTGEEIDAAVAERWGLVNEVVPEERLDGVVAKLAHSLAGMSASGMRAQKRVLRAGEAPYLDQAMHHSIEIFGSAYESGDPGKLMKAFFAGKPLRK